MKDHRFPALSILFLLIFAFTLNVAYAPTPVEYYALIEDRYSLPCIPTSSGCIEGQFAVGEFDARPLFDIEIRKVSQQLNRRAVSVPIVAISVIFIIIVLYSFYYRRRKKR